MVLCYYINHFLFIKYYTEKIIRKEILKTKIRSQCIYFLNYIYINSYRSFAVAGKFYVAYKL